MPDKFDGVKEEVKEVKEEENTKEALDSIYASVVYEKFLESIAEVKVSNDPKEREEKIKKIKDSFSIDGMIVYQDETGGVREEKDIEGFLNKVAKGETSIDFSIDIEQYVKEGAITLEKKKGNDGIEYVKIKKVQLNADYLDDAR